MDKLTNKEHILRALHFRSYFTTELFLKLINDGIKVGANTFPRELRKLQEEEEIIGEDVEGRKEKKWRLNNGELF